MIQKSYHTKAVLPREGALYAVVKVKSSHGTSTEVGRSFSLNVKNGRQFMLSKILTQSVFGHLKHVDTDAYIYLANNYEQDTFVNGLNLRLEILDYHYEYPNFSNRYKYKAVNIKHKRYVQVWKKNDKGKYLFNTRSRVKYDNRRKLTELANQIGVF